MLFTTLLIGISSSIDSLGIGITYGIKKTKISVVSYLILFLVTFFSSTISMIFGNMAKGILSKNIANLIGSFLVIFLGFFMLFQAIKNPHTNCSDFDNSKDIDPFEAIFLGITLSLDSFGIVIGCALTGVYNLLLPFVISTFQVLFLELGSYIGKKICSNKLFPDNSWSIASGVLLVFIGILRLI